MTPENNIGALVSQVLQSPNLRNTIENFIRQTRNESPPTTSVATSSHPSANLLLQQPPHEGQSMRVREELRRIFPTTRSHCASSMPSGLTTAIRNNNRKLNKQKNVTFTSEVILLESFSEKKTVIGKKKALAYEKGFGISSVEFLKSWNSCELKEHLKGLFSSKLGNTDFKILIPMGGYVIEPILAQNQQLDGLNLYHLFYRRHKVIYLRPIEPILECIEMTEHGSSSLSESIEAEAMPFEPSSDHSFDDGLHRFDDGPEPTCLTEIINMIRNQITDEKTTNFNIFRQDIYQCCVRALQRKSFSPYNKISVCFIDSDENSEGAIDAGGPTRELFRLVLIHIKDSQIFEGRDTEKYIVFNKQALERQEYFNTGRLVALSIVHSGLCPRFFADFVFKQIATDFESLEPEIDNICDIEIKQEIELAMQCDNINNLRTVIIEGTYFKLAGWNTISEFNKKDDMIKDVIKFYAAERVTNCVNQLIDGLNIMNLHSYIQKYPEYFVEVFCNTNCQILNVTSFEELFTINYSEFGSNRRQIENKVVAFWKDYLIDCYENETSDYCSLDEILTFCTGSACVPLFGFASPISLNFLHDDSSPFPKGNTCGLQLFLPTTHSDYEAFKSRMTFGIHNGMVFGYS